MKKTITLLILAILTLNSMNLFSQERVNKPIPTIGTQIKGQLTKSTGWLLNPESQWVSRPNKIPSYIENQFKSLIDYEYTGLGIDNFTSYQIRDIKIQDSTYSILIKKFKDGYYKYAEIGEGWTNTNSVMFYVFHKSELRKLDDIVNDSINLIKLNILYSKKISYINNETYISDIQNEIIKQIDEQRISNEIYNYLVFQIAPYREKSIVQFQIYSCTMKGKRYIRLGGMIREHEPRGEKENFSWEQRQMYLSKDLLKYFYYEIDYLTFNNFIKITK